MIDRKLSYSPADIFQGTSAKDYIKYCSRLQPPWFYLEMPMWQIVINEHLSLEEAYTLDVGSGTGKLYDLLILLGAKPERTLALEPNVELANYFFEKNGIHCIKDSSHHLDNPIMQHGEFNLLTANMVVNHMTTPEYGDFVKFTKGTLCHKGLLLYTSPFPAQKAKKHGFDYNDNNIIVEEKAPWGGTVKYHHRSEEYQIKILEENGFRVNRIVWGYEDFMNEGLLELGERTLGKSLRGIKRIMFWAENGNKK